MVSQRVYIEAMGRIRYKLRKVADRPCIQVRWEGSDKWVSTGCRTKEEAREWADSQVGATTKKVLFKDYAQDFFMRKDKDSKRMRDEMDNRKAREGTYYGNQHDTDCYLMPFFKDIPLSSITPKVIDEWKMWMRFDAKKKRGAGNYSSVTINKALSRLSMILDSAVYDGLVQTNCAKAVKKLGGSSKPKPIWSRDELERLFPDDDEELFHIWNGRTYAILCYVLFNTGFRPSEGCALKRSNLFEEKCGIHTSDVIDWYTRQPVGEIKTAKKGKKYKVSIITSRKFWDRLDRYIATLPPEQEYLFLKDNGDFINYSNIWMHIITACRRAGVEFHGSYTFRHNRITQMMDELGDEATKELAGHTTYEVCYDHRTPEMVINSAKRMVDRARMLNHSSSTSENGSHV